MHVRHEKPSRSLHFTGITDIKETAHTHKNHLIIFVTNVERSMKWQLLTWGPNTEKKEIQISSLLRTYCRDCSVGRPACFLTMGTSSPTPWFPTAWSKYTFLFCDILSSMTDQRQQKSQGFGACWSDWILTVMSHPTTVVFQPICMLWLLF